MRIKVESLISGATQTDLAAIERELTKLEGRRIQLAEGLDLATDDATKASAVRRDLIIADQDPPSLAQANAKCREADEKSCALDDALRALDQRIIETTAHLEEARDKAERDRVAQLLEDEADNIEKASLALDKAAKQFASAYEHLRSAMSAVSCVRTPGSQLRLPKDRAASLLAAEALAGAALALFVDEPGELGVASVLRRGFPLGEDVVRLTTRDIDQLTRSGGARKHAELLITTRLRTKAAAIRSGHEPAVLPSAPPEPDPRFIRAPEREITPSEISVLTAVKQKVRRSKEGTV